MPRRFVPHAIFVFGMVLLNALVPRYAIGHFIPEKMMHSLHGMKPEVVLIGNSLLAAGYQGEFRTRTQPSIFNAALGGTTTLENFVTVRRVLEETQPKTIVYGWYSTQLVNDEVRVDDFQGNRLVSVLWAKSDDLSFVFPQFEQQPVEAARYLLMSHLPLAAYAPLVQGRIEVSRRAWGTPKKVSTNRFGADEDFQRMADSSWEDLDARLEKRVLPADADGARFSFSRFVLAIRDLAHARGAKVVWVGMPVIARGYAVAAASTMYRSYVDAARRELASTPGDEFLDASQLDGISDASFADGLHLNERGAAVFTRWLETQLDPPSNAGK